MTTSCNTHDYDGKLREKWFEIRSILIKEYLPNCLSFDDTIKEMEQWLDKKYSNVKRIGRARRSIKILTTQRQSNFDSKNDIDVEELLPILWNKVKNQEDIHDTFYEQLCDITGGSCSQGRSTRLFQFLFLFDLPSETTTKADDEKQDVSTEQEPINTLTDNKQPSEELKSHEEQSTEEKSEEEQQSKKEVEINDEELTNISSIKIE
ncbi:unnamed protein product [Adineta steineri]|uniref:Uncharacterized protein n=1 Tax=Adineta steineri TaxID=433720 RepID=A0A818UC20_9BILA|nr:unnamed protein product [Adineta steineri]CAF3691290.1 unnamed protein product [Adineta steineri]